MKNDYAYIDLVSAAESTMDKDKYRGMTFFVTGATGLVGSVIVKYLLFLNDEYNLDIHVLAQIRSQDKAYDVFGEILNRSDLQIMIQDIRKQITYDKKVDYIIHTASPTSSRYFVTNPVETIETAFLGTKNVLEFSRVVNSRAVVYLSSMEAFGITDPSLGVVYENDLGYIDLRKVRSSYSEGKRICELLCVSYAEEYGVHVRIARLAQTFGASVPISEGRVFAQFAKSVIDKSDIVLHTEGKSEGNYCYTGDVVSAIMLLLLKGNDGEAYTVCNEVTNTTIAHMAEMVVERYGDGSFGVVFDIPKEEKMYGYAPTVKMRLSSKKLQELGWKPSLDLMGMYDRLIASFKKQKGIDLE